MANGATKPIETLREHATALEAACTVCLADPKPKAVHALRTGTRRVEAQLVLLGELHGLPSFRREAAKARKHLKTLRQAAGQVRDLDVQAKLLKQDEARPEFERDAHALAKLRRRRREKAAGELRKALKRHGTRLAGALEALLQALEPAVEQELPAKELVAIVDHEFRATPELGVPKPTADQLHTLRKVAKVARYLAESAPASRRARETASRYETLQDAGGQWHDWMELADEAREDLGRHHRLVEEFRWRSRQHLREFERLLQGFRTV